MVWIPDPNPAGNGPESNSAFIKYLYNKLQTRPLISYADFLCAQSVSSVKEVARSELYRQFLRSGVRVLKEANIVNPLKPTRRRTLLERMKSRAPSADSAEAVVCL